MYVFPSVSSSIPRRLYARSDERAGFDVPDAPLYALCVSRQTKGQRAKKFLEERGGPHGRRRGAERAPAVPAWRRSPHGYIWYV